MKWGGQERHIWASVHAPQLHTTYFPSDTHRLAVSSVLWVFYSGSPFLPVQPVFKQAAACMQANASIR
jgi:hypothetical protein